MVSYWILSFLVRWLKVTFCLTYDWIFHIKFGCALIWSPKKLLMEKNPRWKNWWGLFDWKKIHLQLEWRFTKCKFWAGYNQNKETWPVSYYSLQNKMSNPIKSIFQSVIHVAIQTDLRPGKEKLTLGAKILQLKPTTSLLHRCWADVFFTFLKLSRLVNLSVKKSRILIEPVNKQETGDAIQEAI